MPIIKSAIKRVRQQAKAQERNRNEKNKLRVLQKQFEREVESKAKDAGKTLSQLYGQLDKMQKKNILHSNTVGRRKSALNAKAKAVKIAPTTSKTTSKKAPAAKKTTPKKPAAKKTTTKKATAKKAPAKKSVTKK